MKCYGLTGGVGMGKSTAAQWLAEHGISVVDTDVLARKIVEPGQSGLTELVGEFGSAILAEDGRLLRDKLAEIVFSDEAARRRLESILHPKIRAAWLQQLEQWRHEQKPVAVVVIPLLFETSATAHFDATVCVACSPATQEERLRTRGWTTDQIWQRLHAQWPIETKINLADYVVWTEGSLEVHAEQLKRIIPRG